MKKTLIAKRPLITLFVGTLLLAACSGEAEAQEPATPEPTTASAEPTPTETAEAPTEAELIAWVKGREGFDQLEGEDPKDYLNAQALKAYRFWCSELDKTALPSEVFDTGTQYMFEMAPLWGTSTVRYDKRLDNPAFAKAHKLDVRRPIQYEVATTVRCPEHKEAFRSWVADFR